MNDVLSLDPRTGQATEIITQQTRPPRSYRYPTFPASRAWQNAPTDLLPAEWPTTTTTFPAASTGCSSCRRTTETNEARR